MTVTRRTFIRAGALTAAALPLWDPLSCAGEVQTQERRGPLQRVIVIGAGLAGLCAAYHLVQAGHDVLVLEAQRRAGGRVQTLRDFADDLCGEAGATRIPDHHHFTLRYVKLFGLELDPFVPPGSAVYHLRGRRLVVAPGESPDWPLALTSQERALGVTGMMNRAYGKLVADLGDPTSVDWPAERFWRYDRLSLTEFLRGQGLSDDAIHLRRAALGSSGDTEDPESALRSLSSLALGRPLKTYWRIRGGNDRLPHAFALRLADRIRYGAPVVRLERGPNAEVRVVTNGADGRQLLAADRVVVAVPFSVLRRLEISPPFSAEKAQAIRALPYVSSTKVFVQTRTRFWTQQGLTGFAYTDLLDYMQVWELGHNQPGPRGLLVGYTKRHGARQIGALSETQRLAVTVEAMTKVHPELRSQVEGGTSKSWDEDPWAQGAWATSRPGDMRILEPHVSRPEGRVHFAGEHASPWHGGWMQGALESGERVAREINEAR